jgi:acetyl esterase/lipase
MPSLVSAPTEGIPARDRVVANGWVVVATDYSFAEKGGPHPYIIGEGEARAALDSVRAARQMPELALDARTVVWGHSQGGHAALWTGMIAARYAPELAVVGVAAIAPAADIKNILAMNSAAEKRLGPYLAMSYARFYPELTFESAIRPEALAVAREIVNLCGFVPPEDPQRIAALTATLDGPTLATATNPALAARLAQNAAAGPIPAPLVIAQGLADTVVPPPATEQYVAERCGANQSLDYWTFAGLDHGTIVRPGSALEEPLVAWTRARFAGEARPSGCAREAF